MFSALSNALPTMVTLMALCVPTLDEDGDVAIGEDGEDSNNGESKTAHDEDGEEAEEDTQQVVRTIPLMNQPTVISEPKKGSDGDADMGSSSSNRNMEPVEVTERKTVLFSRPE